MIFHLSLYTLFYKDKIFFIFVAQLVLNIDKHFDCPVYRRDKLNASLAPRDIIIFLKSLHDRLVIECHLLTLALNLFLRLRLLLILKRLHDLRPSKCRSCHHLLTGVTLIRSRLIIHQSNGLAICMLTSTMLSWITWYISWWVWVWCTLIEHVRGVLEHRNQNLLQQ